MRPDIFDFSYLKGIALIPGILLIFLSGGTSFSESPPISQTITISEGLRIATESSRIIKIASFNRDISLSDILVARSRLLPNVSAYANQTFLTYQPGVKLGTFSAYTSDRNSLSYGIDIYQTIYDFGGNFSLYESSKRSYENTELDLKKIKNLVALDFIISCFDLLETEKLISVARSEVERLESHLNVAMTLFNEGVITKNDLLHAEVKLSDARQRLLTVKNLRAINESRLNNILSRPLKSGLNISDVDPSIEYELPPLETAWESAERERVELKVIDNDLKILEMKEAAMRSEYYPRLFAQGGYSFTKNPYQLTEDNWSLILGLNINIFSGESTKAELSKIRYRKDQVLEQKKKLLDDIRLEVEKNYLDIRNSIDKIQVVKDSISQAEENLRINKVRYEEGIGTSTDVLDAITLLTVAETNYYRAVYEYRRSHAALRYTMGMDLGSVYSR